VHMWQPQNKQSVMPPSIDRWLWTAERSAAGHEQQHQAMALGLLTTVSSL
jgi:hypothetical protein